MTNLWQQREGYWKRTPQSIHQNPKMKTDKKYPSIDGKGLKHNTPRGKIVILSFLWWWWLQYDFFRHRLDYSLAIQVPSQATLETKAHQLHQGWQILKYFSFIKGRHDTHIWALIHLFRNSLLQFLEKLGKMCSASWSLCIQSKAEQNPIFGQL